MFNELDDTWPKHDCFNTQFSNLMKTTGALLKDGADPKSATFKPFSDLKAHFEQLAPQSPPDPKLKKQPKSGFTKKTEHLIKKMDPLADEVMSVLGVVRDIQSNTARIKEIYAGLGNLGQQVLGLPPLSRAIALTIVDAEGEPNESYTCLADKNELDKDIKVGVMVWAMLEAKVTKSLAVWLATEIHAV